MPPRRSHKKSRAGCRRCKARKIKCDEVHPKCGNCLKHGVPCDFENPDIVEELLSAATPAALDSPAPMSSTPASSASCDPRTPLPNNMASPATASVSVPASAPDTPLYQQPSLAMTARAASSVESRLLELRLMHHYTTRTSQTLIVASSTDEIWQYTVPRLAFSGASHLADAILAVAALHLRALNPEDKEIVRASHAYMASSLSEYLANLNAGINEKNAETLFLTASLIAFQATASRIFLRDETAAGAAGAKDQYELPLAWFHSFQGVKTVVATSWEWLRNSSIVVPIIETQPVLQLDLNATASGHSFFAHLLDGLDEELAAELAADEGPDVVAQVAATRQSYYHAVSVLSWAHKIPHRGAALAFPATVTRRFVELLEARAPRAMAMLACFFALLKSIDSVWWLQGVARREVMGIVTQFGPDSPWWPHLEWPLRIALYEGSVIPPDVWGSDWVAEEHRMDQSGSSVMSFINHIEMLAQMSGQSAAPRAGPVAPSSVPPIPMAPDFAGSLNLPPFG